MQLKDNTEQYFPSSEVSSNTFQLTYKLNIFLLSLVSTVA